MLRSLLAVAVCTALAAQEQVTVYRGALVFTGGAAPIADGVVVIARGRVQAVGGPGTPVPEGAVVVDVAGRVITPGLVDAAWNGGIAGDANEQSEEVTAALKVLEALDPKDPAFARARQAGVTTVHVMPGTRNVIGGLSAVVKTWGDRPEAMLLKDETALRIVLGAEPSSGNRAIRGGTVDSIYYRRPTTRMGVVWTVRSSFYDAKDWLARTIDGGNPPPDRNLEVLARVLQGRLAVVTTARSEQDLRTALRLAGEFGYTPIIDEAVEAHYVVDELAAAKVWVMVGAPSAERVNGSGAADGAEPRFSTLSRLTAAGVPVVITTGTNAAALDLVREAMFAVRYGVAEQQALDAITVMPARLLGVDDRVGSLAAGRDADLVVWSTHPFDPAAEPLTVLVGGQPVPASR
jgi:imidazolonepropionase-like amidohydrolase